MVKVIGDGLPVVVCPLAYRRMVHFAAYHVPEEPPGWSFVQIVTKDQPGAHSHAPAGGQTESGICFGSAGPKGSTAEYDTF